MCVCVCARFNKTGGESLCIFLFIVNCFTGTLHSAVRFCGHHEESVRIILRSPIKPSVSTGVVCSELYLTLQVILCAHGDLDANRNRTGWTGKGGIHLFD